jgi:hypothetical protein
MLMYATPRRKYYELRGWNWQGEKNTGVLVSEDDAQPVRK